MPLLKVKLIEADKLASAKTKIDAYLTAQTLVNGLRGLASDAYKESDGDTRRVVALAHGGLALPASGSKVGNLQVLSVEAQGVAAAQIALDEALANAVHDTDPAGNANTTPGSITVGTAMFAAEDVGRGILIGTNKRTITTFTSATVVVYSGAAITGTGLAVSMLGAESLQPGTLDVSVFKGDTGQGIIAVTLAVNGEALA